MRLPASEAGTSSRTSGKTCKLRKIMFAPILIETTGTFFPRRLSQVEQPDGWIIKKLYTEGIQNERQGIDNVQQIEDYRIPPTMQHRLTLRARL